MYMDTILGKCLPLPCLPVFWLSAWHGSIEVDEGKPHANKADCVRVAGSGMLSVLSGA